jgi:hypothetical protein
MMNIAAGKYIDVRNLKGGLPTISFAMLRSFVELGTSLNLTSTVSRLGVSRQTIRRHIRDLELILQLQLFETGVKTYQLTEQGREFLAESSRLMDHVQDVMSGVLCASRHAHDVTFNPEGERYYLSKQHSLMDCSNSNCHLIRHGFASWMSSRGQLSSDELERLMPFLAIYRYQRDGWVYMHVGEQSSLATWLGPVWARSEIGTFVHDDAVANPSDRFVFDAYKSVFVTGSPRLDHVATVIPVSREGEMQPINYQRLTMVGVLPDGTHVLLVLSVRTNEIDVGYDKFALMPPHRCMADQGADLEVI